MYDYSKVVVVDDDAVFGQMLKGWMRYATQISTAKCFTSGAAFEESFKDRLSEVAVLIIDFDLHEAKTGAEIIKDIRSNWNEGEFISIIAVSGNEMEHLRREFRASGADLIFQKGQLERESLRDNVQAMLHLAADRRVKATELQELNARIFQLEQKISVTSLAIKQHLFTEGDSQAASLLRQLERNLKD
jgi:FixJ family two-component response regulator